MSTHRYPLPDGRELEINDPAFDGRAHVYVDGELLGEDPVSALRTPRLFELRDGSSLMIHVVDSAPFFRTFDVRVNGVPLPGSASESKNARRTVIELLLLAAIVDCIYRMPAAPLDYVRLCVSAAAIAVAVTVGLRLRFALQAANYFMIVHCVLGMVGGNGNIDLTAFGMYFWMRYLTSSSERESEPTPRSLPRVTFSETHAP